MSNLLANCVRLGVLAGFFAIFTLSAWAVCAPTGPGPTGPGTANLRLREAMDTDHDCKADFTIFRPTDNVWYTMKSGGGFSYTQFCIGSAGYMTPGGYDGDCKGVL